MVYYIEDLALTFDNIDVECLFIEMSSCSFFGGKKVVIGCIYWPPDSDNGSLIEILASTSDFINVEDNMFYIGGLQHKLI